MEDLYDVGYFQQLKKAIEVNSLFIGEYGRMIIEVDLENNDEPLAHLDPNPEL